MKKAKKSVSKAAAKISKSVAKKSAKGNTPKVGAKAVRVKEHKPKIKIRLGMKKANGVRQAKLVEEKASFNFDNLPVPFLMRFQTPPGATKFTAAKSGPFCQVLVECNYSERVKVGERRVEDQPAQMSGDGKKILVEATYRFEPVCRTVLVHKVPVWVRAVSGDERNGMGYVYLAHARAEVEKDFPIGKRVRWAGGTRLTLAKVCAVTDLPVSPIRVSPLMAQPVNRQILMTA
jgi:hypothetical protein